jgi:hypothetical protein
MGRPQFLFPLHLEQLLTAKAIQGMGCGLNLAGHTTDPGELIRRTLKLGSLQAAATAVAATVDQRVAENVSEKIIQTCRKHLE